MRQGETKEEVLEVVEPEGKKETRQEEAPAAAEAKGGVKAKARKETGMFDRVETIRIVGPGSYELNIDKMAKSDERIVSVGDEEGSYIIDLMSMAKDDTKPKRSKRR